MNKREQLLVLEVMTMQTTIYPPVGGTVKEFCVKARDAVEARDLMLVIE